ncbi:cell division control protein 48 isoform X2 [Lycium ferocissimum]|uniref:cell division control protein 48 isoform X2 n=1 Tax=Lycium ferocissimum TaxID=112874 RepID=UPI0028157ED6|nr:cell division control protein 48 isoform X2 [Lycium ferocissimum]
MALSIRRVGRALHSHYRTLALSPSPHNGNFGCHGRTFSSRSVPSTTIPAILAGLLGVGVLDVTYADSDEVGPKVPPSDSPPIPSHNPLEETAKAERRRLENLLKSKGVKYGSYPRFTVAVKGQKVTIKFQVPPTCEIPLLIASLVSRLGVKLEDPSAASNMMLRAWDSGVAWQLALSHPQTKNGTPGEQAGGRDTNPYDEDLCILIFRPLISADKAEIEFMKPGSFTDEELDALVSALELAGQQKTVDLRSRGDAGRVPSADKTVTTLESMGVKIFGINAPTSGNPKANITWENIAGYNQQKRDIEDTILLALQSPEVYDDIARGTRRKFETNRPRAVLFEGPPGTGKTSCARVIANQAGVPLLYVPLEIIMSKYYGESERLLGKVFSLANDLPNGAIVFLDEVDSFATARDGETHEATRRLLSVLLRQIDGFEQEKKVVVVAATNRKQDLDPALISRFDSMITFPLPDQQTRQEIAAQYAKHLTDSELSEFARATEGLSGRDMRDVCQQAERRWASKIIRGQAPKDEGTGGLLPPLQDYVDSARNRQRALLDIDIQNRSMNPASKKPQFDFV